MSDQAEQANKTAREIAGGKLDEVSMPGQLAVQVTAAGVSAEPPAPTKPPSAPYVRLPMEGHQLGVFAKELGGILACNGVFRRDRESVTIDPDHGEMVPMSPDRFRSYVEDHCVTARFVWAKDNPEPVKRAMTMSGEQARGVLSSDRFINQQRPLEKVNLVRQPVLRADGRIELLPEGYDRETRTYTVAGAVKIDEDVTFEAAHARLMDLHAEFPWGDEEQARRSRAVHVAAMLAMYASALLPLNAARPGYLYTANAPGSGKTLLAQMCLVPLYGTARITPLPKEEEFKKELDTAAREGRPYMLLDNLSGLLRNETLEAFITASVWGGRKLGAQASFEAPKLTQVFVTGNSLQLSTDLSRRLLVVELFTQQFEAQERPIKREIDAQWLARPEVRRDILSALWALVRHWDKAGRPPASKMLRGFEPWSRAFGGIVEVAGFGCATEPPKLSYAGDQESDDMQTLVQALVEELGREGPIAKGSKLEWSFDRLVEACREIDAFSFMLDGKVVRPKDGEEYFDLTPRAKATMGKMFAARYGGRLFRVRHGERDHVVQFGQRGKNRSRRYSVEVMQ